MEENSFMERGHPCEIPDYFKQHVHPARWVNRKYWNYLGYVNTAGAPHEIRSGTFNPKGKLSDRCTNQDLMMLDFNVQCAGWKEVKGKSKKGTKRHKIILLESGKLFLVHHQGKEKKETEDIVRGMQNLFSPNTPKTKEPRPLCRCEQVKQDWEAALRQLERNRYYRHEPTATYYSRLEDLPAALKRAFAARHKIQKERQRKSPMCPPDCEHTRGCPYHRFWNERRRSQLESYRSEIWRSLCKATNFSWMMKADHRVDTGKHTTRLGIQTKMDFITKKGPPGWTVQDWMRRFYPRYFWVFTKDGRRVLPLRRTGNLISYLEADPEITEGLDFNKFVRYSREVEQTDVEHWNRAMREMMVPRIGVIKESSHCITEEELKPMNHRLHVGFSYPKVSAKHLQRFWHAGRHVPSWTIIPTFELRQDMLQLVLSNQSQSSQ